MFSLAPDIIVFDGEHAMLRWSAALARIDVGVPAARAVTPAAASGSRQAQLGAAGGARAELGATCRLIEFTARRADDHILRVSPFRRQQIAGEQIECLTACRAVERLDPQERLHRHLGVAIEGAAGPIVCPELLMQCIDEILRGAPVCLDVEVFDLFTDDPGCHGVDVESLDVAPEPIRLY